MVVGHANKCTAAGGAVPTMQPLVMQPPFSDPDPAPDSEPESPKGVSNPAPVPTPSDNSVESSLSDAVLALSQQVDSMRKERDGDMAKIFTKIERLCKQQATDVEAVMTIIDNRVSGLENRFVRMERQLLGDPGDGLTPMTSDEPMPEDAEGSVPEVLKQLHESFAKTPDYENIIRSRIFKALHTKRTNLNRGTFELKKDGLTWGVRYGFMNEEAGDVLGIIEEYVAEFLESRTFALHRSIKKQFPKTDFKIMGNFWSNLSRSINIALNKVFKYQ